MKEQIKELRVKIDGLAQLTKELESTIKKKATEFYKGEMWSFTEEGLKTTDTGWRSDNSIRINSKEVKKTIDSLYLAKAWLGKVLGELQPKYCIIEYDPFQEEKRIVEYGNNENELIEKCKKLGRYFSVVPTNPYGSGYKTKEDIEPATDKQSFLRHPDKGYKTTIEEFEDKNHIEKVDWLRQEIKKINEDIMSIKTGGIVLSYANNINTTNVFNHLSEARFWLGFELERVREEKAK